MPAVVPDSTGVDITEEGPKVWIRTCSKVRNPAGLNVSSNRGTAGNPQLTTGHVIWRFLIFGPSWERGGTELGGHDVAFQGAVLQYHHMYLDLNSYLKTGNALTS